MRFFIFNSYLNRIILGWIELEIKMTNQNVCVSFFTEKTILVSTMENFDRRPQNLLFNRGLYDRINLLNQLCYLIVLVQSTFFICMPLFEHCIQLDKVGFNISSYVEVAG